MDKQSIIAKAKDEYQEFCERFSDIQVWDDDAIEERLRQDNLVKGYNIDKTRLVDVNFKSITATIFADENSNRACISCYVDVWDENPDTNEAEVIGNFKM